MTDLDRLIEAVEGGQDRAPFWKVWEPENEGGQLAYVADRAYRGSLDAALSLMEALLPGFMGGIQFRGDKHFAGLWDGQGKPTVFNAQASNPARALLLAVLKAYRETRG